MAIFGFGKTAAQKAEEQKRLEEVQQRQEIEDAAKARDKVARQQGEVDAELNKALRDAGRADGTFAVTADRLGIPSFQADINKDPNIGVGQFVEHTPTDFLFSKIPDAHSGLNATANFIIDGTSEVYNALLIGGVTKFREAIGLDKPEGQEEATQKLKHENVASADERPGRTPAKPKGNQPAGKSGSVIS